MKAVSFKNVELGGFWKNRFELNRTATIPTVYDRFVDTGRFEAFKFQWKEGDENQPHIFWDSDVAKWIEGVAYSITKHPDSDLEKVVDCVVDLIEKNQGEDGYFNIYYTVCEPDNRFTNRLQHELYCAGHLAEAAVAYYDATGKDKFLRCICRYMDYIDKVFRVENSADFMTPGHEEIELALVKLAECTGEEKYMELARWFVNTRGDNQPDRDNLHYIGYRYSQSHVPVREQFTAEGHSVRAVYLYCAMADLALRDGDEGLYNACRKLIENIAHKRMYVTGGIGSTSYGEAFSRDYDLPNDVAYSESCAAIGLALFARRMSLIEADSLYADVAERAIYNNVLSSTSLDGHSFFYENPLEINLKQRETVTTFYNTKQHYPITERLEVFGCSCCPPNIMRFVASIGDFISSYDGKALYVHHYIDSKSDDGEIKLSISTSYPENGRVTLSATGLGGRKLAVRIPAWCRSYTCSKSGETVKGYLYLDVADGEEVELDFDMTPYLVKANAFVENNLGRAALQSGPFVYCLEGVDNNAPLNQLSVSRELNAVKIKDEKLGLDVIEADGFIESESDALYAPLEDSVEKTRLRFIPYYAFANRGETDMLVWVRYSPF